MSASMTAAVTTRTHPTWCVQTEICSAAETSFEHRGPVSQIWVQSDEVRLSMYQVRGDDEISTRGQLAGEHRLCLGMLDTPGERREVDVHLTLEEAEMLRVLLDRHIASMRGRQFDIGGDRA